MSTENVEKSNNLTITGFSLLLLFYSVFFSGDAIQKPIRINGNHPPMTPVRTSSVLTSRNSTSHINAITQLTSSMNNSLNNILNYSPPQYLDKNNVTKSTTSIASNNNNLNAIQTASNGNEIKVAAPSSSSSSSNGHSSNSASNKIYGTSLLCYQNVSPPSPTSSIVHENGNHAGDSSTEKITEENKSYKDSKSSSAITLSALIPGDTTTLPVAVKKRSKLRHRFSDVGSWGLRKKDRAHKYRSMNIESVEVLGDPVIEDIFFVSRYFFFAFSIGSLFSVE